MTPKNFITARKAKIQAGKQQAAKDGTFAEMEHSLAHRKGVHDPKALAAFIGRKAGKIP